MALSDQLSTQSLTQSMIFRVLPPVINLIAGAANMLGAAGAVPRYLNILAAIVGQAEPAYDELVKLKALIERMVIENREPTGDEWSSWQTRSDVAHDAIQGEVISDDEGIRAEDEE